MDAIPKRTPTITAEDVNLCEKKASRNRAKSGPVKSPVKKRAFESNELCISAAMNAQSVLSTAQRIVHFFALAKAAAFSERTSRMSLTVVLPKALIALDKLLIAAA